MAAIKLVFCPINFKIIHNLELGHNVFAIENQHTVKVGL